MSAGVISMCAVDVYKYVEKFYVNYNLDMR